MAVKTVIYYFLRSVGICSQIITACIGLFNPSKKNYLPSLKDPLLLEPAHSLTKRIKNGQLKSEDLVKAYIKRIKEVNPLINALTDQRFESAIDEAKHIDRRIEQHLSGDLPIDLETLESMPLLGIPVSIKECQSVKGMSYTGGLYSRKNVKAKEDGAVVKNIRKAGAIPLCVTNVPEFAFGWDTYNSIYGQTNNPYDKSCIPGGSSGGEGALISAAGSVVGIGSDIAGSIRIPAYFCGLFGHKTSEGIVPIEGFFPFVGHKDRERYLQIGPICRYASDLRPMLRGCAGSQSSRLKLDEKLDLNQLKVFYVQQPDGGPLTSPVCKDVLNAMRRVVKCLSTKSGKPAKEVFLPLMKNAFMVWACTFTNLDAPYLLHELTERTTKLNGWSELFKWFVGKSHFRLTSILTDIIENIFDPNTNRVRNYFQNFVKNGEQLKTELTQLLGDNGVLLCPSLPEPYVKHNVTLLKSFDIGYNAIFNITGHPVTQVPLGLNKNGLPIGLQIVTNPLNDHLSIGVAELLEKEFGGWVPPFPTNTTS